MTSSPFTRSLAWRALAEHKNRLEHHHMKDLFAADPDRFERFSRQQDGLFIDFSKNRIDDAALRSLLDLAEEREVEAWRERMFAGETINETESRAVLHVALRDPDGSYRTGDQDVSADVRAVNAKMAAFVDAIHSGTWKGATGKPIRTIVNIGIGGSHLGPQAAVTALASHRVPQVDVRFVSNVDGHDLADTLAAVDAEDTLAAVDAEDTLAAVDAEDTLAAVDAEDTLAAVDAEDTLFLVASKTFTTQETMTNAASARAWVVDALGEAAIAKHFVALSTNREAVVAFGIDADNIFEFWDWVGGRYSLWSAIGLSIALAIGWERFEALLAGARAMDRHFREAPLDRNLPVLMALIGIWNVNFLGMQSIAILPYDQRLQLFPAMLQQLDMESNGKRVGITGADLDHSTAPVLWGQAGTNGQHSFHQLLHQGTEVVPADFVIVANPDHGLAGHQEKLISHALAQSQALMSGRTLDEAGGNPHRVFPGNRPSNTIVLERLDPRSFGMLTALYEHKVFVQGAVWGLNSFDQWGVELGKELAGHLLGEITGDGGAKAKDASTDGLMKKILSLRT